MTEKTIYLATENVQRELDSLSKAGFFGALISPIGNCVLYAGPPGGLAFPAIQREFGHDARVVEYNFKTKVWEIVQ
jgi:hypothetical protein